MQTTKLPLTREDDGTIQCEQKIKASSTSYRPDSAAGYGSILDKLYVTVPEYLHTVIFSDYFDLRWFCLCYSVTHRSRKLRGCSLRGQPSSVMRGLRSGLPVELRGTQRVRVSGGSGAPRRVYPPRWRPGDPSPCSHSCESTAVSTPSGRSEEGEEPPDASRSPGARRAIRGVISTRRAERARC